MQEISLLKLLWVYIRLLATSWLGWLAAVLFLMELAGKLVPKQKKKYSSRTRRLVKFVQRAPLGMLATACIVIATFDSWQAEYTMRREILAVDKSRYALIQLSGYKSSYPVVPFPLNEQLSWNSYYANSGNDFARHVRGDGQMFILNDGTDAAQSKAIAEFSAAFGDIMRTPISGITLPPATSSSRQTFWFTAKGPILTKELNDALANGTKVLMLIGAVRYEDGTGKYEVHNCTVLQQPKAGSALVWHSCVNYVDVSTL